MANRLTLKRLNGEVADLDKNRNIQFQAVCDETDMFTFFFLLRNLDGNYEGGYYIGKIVVPVEYPVKAGDFIMLTPNGRFDIGKKICLTNSGYHPESWTPMWTIRSMLLGFISIFTTDDTTGLSHIRESDFERKQKAMGSISYNKVYYPDIFKKFHYFVNEDLTIKSNEEIELLVSKPIVVPKAVLKTQAFDLDMDKLDSYTFNDFIKYFTETTYNTFKYKIYKYFGNKY
jgi:ubiquitin-conjugating enzyme E2 J1